MSGFQSNTGTPSSAARAVPPSVNGWQAEFLDSEYQRFRADPTSVPPDLAAFFRGFDLAMGGGAAAAGSSPVQSGADRLTHAYREFGHLGARTNPLGAHPERPESIGLAANGLSEQDLDRTVQTDAIPGRTTATLRELISHLDQVYTASTGAEYMHVAVSAEREWFRRRLELGEGRVALTAQDRVELLKQLTAPEVFDKFLGKRYQGKKRFSLEGAEELIPLLKWLTRRAGELGTQEIILGMPHRGRLSVLRNYLGKDLQRLFTEFEDAWQDGENEGGGDVKYHRGYSGDQALADGRSVHLSMLNNPSHLESVNGVVMGKCRAKQDLVGDSERRKVISVLMHGDAAVAGQGVVAECLTMSQLEGYTVGGTIHVVVNNQVGFTTDQEDARSTVYCTDVAKSIGAPVLHVNGDDPEAMILAAMLAAEYRHEFRKDVFVELVCFRRYGHNEQDEPNYTQPLLYALVRQHPGTPETYRRTLIASGVVSEQDAQAMIDQVQAELDAAQAAAKAKPVDPVPPAGQGVWKGIQGKYSFDQPRTAVDAATIAKVCTAMGTAKPGFNVHPKLVALLQARASLPQTGKLSHADAEQIAIGTLVLDGHPVRLSGQDSRRGTFTQRHAVLRDEKTGERYTPLNHIREGQAVFSVWDSPLSEYSVMGFDYGYSRGQPNALVMWEGQFGDFCNTAQVIIDQYMAASEVKWSRWGGLVLLLPHGYEGQGPEHSSGRMERFLQLCADDNMEVVYPSTAAQTFHLLRRQVMRNFRKPLIVMTPKKFLRTETATIDELTKGEFRHLIDDPAPGVSPKSVERVLFCSGKFYHELAAKRAETGSTSVAIVRVEQLYPFHAAKAREINARYPASAKRIWVQEEPRNAGAYIYIADVFREQLGVNLAYVGRPASASPATGSEHAHKDHQERLIAEALGLPAPKAHAKAGSNGHAPAPEAKPTPKPTPQAAAKSKR